MADAFAPARGEPFPSAFGLRGMDMPLPPSPTRSRDHAARREGIRRHRTDLVWIVVDGEFRHVAEFRGLLPPDRPLALCPVCDAKVIMKLGERRTPHVAHCSGSSCPTSNPETARHLNAKLDLWRKLKAASSLSVNLVCENADRCNPPAVERWVEGWIDVDVEV